MYYITICTKDRKQLFGSVVGVDLGVDPPQNAFVTLSPIGKIVNYYLRSIPIKFPNVRLDEYVIMPNHVHFIIEIMGVIAVKGSTPKSTPTADVPSIIRWYKTVTYSEFFRVESIDNGAYIGKLWQRNYYEHIVRGKGDLERIRTYIRDNPAKWNHDRTNTHAR